MLRSPQKKQWLEAEKKEMYELLKNKTWKTFRGKARKKPISCKWVYKIKPPTSLNPEPIFKARLVAHGYKQKAYIDYFSTFAQVATMKSLRIFIWLTAVFGYKATQCDFKSAFVQAEIDTELYMNGPPGYSEEGEIVLLQKSIYGIKQAPRLWYQTLIKYLHTLGFKELVSDSCVLKHKNEKCYILLFVDDLIILTKNEQLRKESKI